MNRYVTAKEETEFDMGNVSPNRGGCWFCHRDDGEMSFSTEFDTFYHSKCARKASVENYENPVLEYERR